MYTIDIITSTNTTITTNAITKIAVEDLLNEISSAIDIDRIIVFDNVNVVCVVVAENEIYTSDSAMWREWTITSNDGRFDLPFAASGVTACVDDAPLTSGVTACVDDAPLTSGVTVDDEIEDIKTVTFGCYEGESIEWIVLEERNDERVLISAKGLDTRPYNAWWTDVTWETCDLRKWMNEKFYNAAFSAEEQELIVTTKVAADKNPDYSTDSGNDTEDKVWLLSITEANKYFANDEARKCAPTSFTVIDDDYDRACWWWLRSPGNFSNFAAYVRPDGSVDTRGEYTDYGDWCVRPVIVIKG